MTLRHHALPLVLGFAAVAITPGLDHLPHSRSRADAAPARFESTCPNPANAGDEDAWDYYNGSTAFRSWMDDAMNLPETKWNEGWGWHDDDSEKEYNKMISATILLAYGITSEGRDWYARALPPSVPALNASGPPSAPSAILRKPSSREVSYFMRSGTGRLVHVEVDPTKATGELVEDVTGAAVGPHHGALHYRSPVPFVVAGDQKLRVVAPTGYVTGSLASTLGVDPGTVLLYEETGVAAPWGWRVTALTSQGMGNPTPLGMDHAGVVATDFGAHIFGPNASGHLIHMTWSATSGVTGTLNVTLNSPSPGTLGSVRGRPAGLLLSDGSLRIAAIAEDGHLLLFTRSSAGSWDSVDATDDAATTLILDAASELSIARLATGELGVAGRDANGHIILYRMRVASGAWLATDLSAAVPSVSNYTTRVAPQFTRAGTQDLIVGINNVTPIVFGRDGTAWPGVRLHAGIINDTARTLAGGVAVTMQRNVSFGSGSGTTAQIFGVDASGRMLGYRCHTECHLGPSWDIDLLNVDLYAGSTLDATTEPQWPPVSGGSFSSLGEESGADHVAALNPARSRLVAYGRRWSRSWHTNWDYVVWASGLVHGFRYEPHDRYKKDGKTYDAWAVSGWGTTDRAEMWCPSFQGDEGETARRAATMLHESTHITYGSWKGIWKHGSGGRDHWYSHGLHDIGPDELGRSDKHSMRQIQVEFLADIAEFPGHWITWDIMEEAKSDANSIINDRFSNTVPWTVGVPRPY